MKQFRHKLALHMFILVAVSFSLGYLLSVIEVSLPDWRASYFIVVTLFAIITLSISYHLAKEIMKPLAHIITVARQISQMNYRARVKGQREDEIGQLSEAINHMASSLEIQMERISENENRLASVLENMTSGVIMIDRAQQIALVNRAAAQILGSTEKSLLAQPFQNVIQHHELKSLLHQCIGRKAAVREEMTFYAPVERVLEVQLVPLFERVEWIGVMVVLHDISNIRRLEKMRSEFVANVSHELKTPVASVKGFAETLISGAIDDKEAALSFLQIIYHESERLDRLIQDILELSRIESRQVPLNLQPVDLKLLLSTTLHMLESEAAKKGIQLIGSVREGLFIEADEDRLQQIFMNLISNAINYTPEGGRVEIEADQSSLIEPEQAEWVRVTVADTGIGIPEHDLPRIFERFYRVDKARSRGSGGTGLGLSIVKHLVELHRGHIHVDSELNVGTTIRVDLPIIQEHEMRS